MFRKAKTTTLDFLDSNTFQYNNDYESVMQFIPKNKTIAEHLAKFQSSFEDQENIKQFSDAVAEGNYTAPIFSHPFCQLYSLYLLNNKQIAFNDFFTANIFLNTYMQFSKLQTVKTCDLDIKKEGEIKFVKFADVRKKIIKQMQSRFFEKHTYACFDIKNFDKRMSELSAAENVILVISMDVPVYDDIKRSMEELCSYSSTIFEHKGCFYIPSATMMTIILHTINPQHHLKMAPFFGNINSHTLYLIHQRGYHPVSLYSPFVVSNPYEVHNHRLGPLVVLLHDAVAHAGWGNVLAKNHYQFTYEYLLPTTAKLLDISIIEVMDKAYSDIESPSLFKILDLNFLQRHFLTEKTYANFYLYECIWNALGEADDQAQALVNIFIKDETLIWEKFGVDIVEAIHAMSIDKKFSNLLCFENANANRYK